MSCDIVRYSDGYYGWNCSSMQVSSECILAVAGGNRVSDPGGILRRLGAPHYGEAIGAIDNDRGILKDVEAVAELAELLKVPLTVEEDA